MNFITSFSAVSIRFNYVLAILEFNFMSLTLFKSYISPSYLFEIKYRFGYINIS